MDKMKFKKILNQELSKGMIAILFGFEFEVTRVAHEVDQINKTKTIIWHGQLTDNPGNDGLRETIDRPVGPFVGLYNRQSMVVQA